MKIRIANPSQEINNGEKRSADHLKDECHPCKSVPLVHLACASKAEMFWYFWERRPHGEKKGTKPGKILCWIIWILVRWSTYISLVKWPHPRFLLFEYIINKISVWSLTMLWWQKFSKNYSWTFDICKLLEAPWSQCFSSKTHTKSKLILWLGIFSHAIDNYSNSTASHGYMVGYYFLKYLF